MRIRRRVICGGLLCVCLMMTGCGTELTKLNSDEEQQVVMYASKVVSKFNRSQDRGYAYVSQERKDAKKNPVVEENPQNPADETGQDTIPVSEMLGIPGVVLSYQGYDLSKTFQTDNITIPDPQQGNTYLILKFQLSNVSGQAMSVDLLTNQLKYKLDINNATVVDVVSTLSEMDLSTYYNTQLQAGATQDVVLLFETTEAIASQITELSLQVTKDGQDRVVAL